jgi:hypothetical protein
MDSRLVSFTSGLFALGLLAAALLMLTPRLKALRDQAVS